MQKTTQLFKELKENRLVALLTPDRPEVCVKAYEAFQPEGIVLEVALRSPHALEGIRQVLRKHPEALLLAGTVMTREQALAALEAGATGLVSADYIPEVVDCCVEREALCIPGGLGDAGKQLAHKAKAYGCSLEQLKAQHPYQWIYKLFPAFAGPVEHLDLAAAWRGPFKDLAVLYAGGINLETVRRAAQKDPGGIFCASALCRNLEDDQRLRETIAQWQAALQPAAKKPAGNSAAGARVVTFGELMARLSPPAGIRLEQARNLDLGFGGAEANVAVSLARFGLPVSFVSALPENDLAENALAGLRAQQVDTGWILRQGSRMGNYFLEHGAGPRPSKVVYDRFPSALSEIVPGAFDWERILEGARWFHWTGITPALGKGVAACLKQGLETARAMGVQVSADLNYRGKLWSREQAETVMTELMDYVDLLIANEEDAHSVFGIAPEGTDLDQGRLNKQGYQQVAEALKERFNFKRVAITLRESISASENRWSACLYDGVDFHLSRTYHVWIVDRVGAGDAFAAGLIHGILTGRDDPGALDFAVAASCLKHTVAGDFNWSRVEEVERLARGATSGRVQR